MTLMLCRECAKPVSTKATGCPHCGAPPPAESQPLPPAGKQEYTTGQAVGVIALATVTVLGFAMYDRYEAQPKSHGEVASEPVCAKDNLECRGIGSEIERYGMRLPAAFVAKTIAYKSTEQTMAEPLISYLVSFTTSDPSFMSNPRAASDKVAYAENTGKRLVWEQKFCTNELKAIMRSARINIVSGEIQSRDGQGKFIAMCTRD